MPSENRRTILAVYLTLLIVLEAIVYVATAPQTGEQFFQLHVLGTNGIAANYYPNGNANVSQGESVGWYLGVTDFMGSVQLVAINVKLGNQSFSPPDDLKGIPSPAPVLANFSQFIGENQTWEIPFVWQISNVSTLGGSTRILQMQINNETYEVRDVSAQNGYNFRLIFELWTWNEDSASFQFGWLESTEHRVAWLQIWFNATG